MDVLSHFIKGKKPRRDKHSRNAMIPMSALGTAGAAAGMAAGAMARPTTSTIDKKPSGWKNVVDVYKAIATGQPLQVSKPVIPTPAPKVIGLAAAAPMGSIARAGMLAGSVVKSTPIPATTTATPKPGGWSNVVNVYKAIATGQGVKFSKPVPIFQQSTGIKSETAKRALGLGLAPASLMFKDIREAGARGLKGTPIPPTISATTIPPAGKTARVTSIMGMQPAKYYPDTGTVITPSGRGYSVGSDWQAAQVYSNELNAGRPSTTIRASTPSAITGKAIVEGLKRAQRDQIIYGPRAGSMTSEQKAYIRRENEIAQRQSDMLLRKSPDAVEKYVNYRYADMAPEGKARVIEQYKQEYGYN